MSGDPNLHFNAFLLPEGGGEFFGLNTRKRKGETPVKQKTQGGKTLECRTRGGVHNQRLQRNFCLALFVEKRSERRTNCSDQN